MRARCRRRSPRIRLPQQPPRLARPAPGRLRRGRAARAPRRYGRARVGVFLGTSTSGILRDRARLPAARPGTARCRRTFDYAAPQHASRSPSSCGARCGSAGPAVVISSACSSSAKVFASARACDRGRADRRGAGRRRRLAVPDDALRFSLAAAGLARSPAAPSTSRATASRSARPRPSRCSSATARQPAADARAAARHRRVERCLPHVLAATRRAPARARPCRRRSRRPASAARATSTTSTCTAPARRATMRPRRAPWRDAVRRAASPAAPPRAPPATRSGAAGALEAVICALALQQGLMPGGPQHHAARSGAAGQLSAAQPRRRACAAS